jgi:predicted O-methyltransferase YrrM
MLDEPRTLPLLTGASLSADNCYRILQWIERNKPSALVELGSGASTAIIAAQLRSLKSGHLYTVENGESYARETRELIEGLGLADRATVIHAPLEQQSVGGRTHTWYANEALASLPDEIDLLIVDGPFGKSDRLSRYPALPLLYPRLTPGAVIFLDDARRSEERAVMRMWSSEYPAFRHSLVESSNGLGVLESKMGF